MLDTYSEILRFIRINVIILLPIIIITILLAKNAIGSKVSIRLSLNIVKWVIISYATFSFLNFVIGVNVSPDDVAFVSRLNGEYKYAYWILAIVSMVLPLSLLYKRLGDKKYYILLISIVMNSGWLYEQFVIRVTSFHRDFVPNAMDNSGAINIFPTLLELIFISQGIIIGLILLMIGNLYAKRQNLKAE